MFGSKGHACMATARKQNKKKLGVGLKKEHPQIS